MKRFAILLTLLVVGLNFTFGQTAGDSISMKKVFGGYNFYQGDKRLSMNNLGNAIMPNKLAFNQFNSARSSYTIAMILSCAGGAMIGWPIGAALAGGDPNWVLAGIGTGLIVIAIPIENSFIKKTRQAIDTYNEGLQSSPSDKNSLELSFTDRGFGLTLKF